MTEKNLVRKLDMIIKIAESLKEYSPIYDGSAEAERLRRLSKYMAEDFQLITEYLIENNRSYIIRKSQAVTSKNGKEI